MSYVATMDNRNMIWGVPFDPIQLVQPLSFRLNLGKLHETLPTI